MKLSGVSMQYLATVNCLILCFVKKTVLIFIEGSVIKVLGVKVHCSITDRNLYLTTLSRISKHPVKTLPYLSVGAATNRLNSADEAGVTVFSVTVESTKGSLYLFVLFFWARSK